MRWFGKQAWSEACDDYERAPVPAGAACLWCEESIEPDAEGVLMPWMTMEDGEPVIRERAQHAECFLRQLGGSYLHQLGLCGCEGGRRDRELEAEIEKLSRREEAILAAELFGRTGKEARARAARTVH